jgi:hypothetical protein
MSAESRLFKAIEEMAREYQKNPSPILQRRIDAAKDRYDRMRASKGKNKNKKKLTIST